MVLVRDVTVGEGESVAPGSAFLKTWRVQNPGPDPWPPGCILRYTPPPRMLIPMF
jgi:next-to-BRCA1 protein 1